MKGKYLLTLKLNLLNFTMGALLKIYTCTFLQFLSNFSCEKNSINALKSVARTQRVNMWYWIKLNPILGGRWNEIEPASSPKDMGLWSDVRLKFGPLSATLAQHQPNIVIKACVTTRWYNVVLMLGQHRRRWASIKPALILSAASNRHVFSDPGNARYSINVV